MVRAVWKRILVLEVCSIQLVIPLQRKSQLGWRPAWWSNAKRISIHLAQVKIMVLGGCDDLGCPLEPEHSTIQIQASQLAPVTGNKFGDIWGGDLSQPSANEVELPKEWGVDSREEMEGESDESEQTDTTRISEIIGLDVTRLETGTAADHANNH
jgi:hypothetical protein